jgi:hypothetical protein
VTNVFDEVARRFGNPKYVRVDNELRDFVKRGLGMPKRRGLVPARGSDCNGCLERQDTLTMVTQGPEESGLQRA